MSYLEKSPADLFASLDEEPDAPSRVDIAAAMATGRRRHRGRVAAAGAAVATLVGGTVIGGTLAFGGASPEPVPDCVADPLPMGRFTSIMVTGADPTGRYVAGLADPLPGQRSSVVIWRDGAIAEILRRPGVQLTDITSDGVGVGSDNTRAYVYRDGTFTALRGERTTAVAVTGSGVVVGEVGSRPARWASPEAAPTLLPLPPGMTEGRTLAAGPDGTVAGFVSQPGAPVFVGYVWRADGTHGPVPLPSVGGTRATFFRPESVHGGWVYGTLHVPARGGEPGPDGIQSLETFPFRHHVGTGRSEVLPEPADRTRAALYAGDRMVTLPPDPTAPTGSGYRVVDVAEDGRTAVGESDTVSGGLVRPVVWRCDGLKGS